MGTFEQNPIDNRFVYVNHLKFFLFL